MEFTEEEINTQIEALEIAAESISDHLIYNKVELTGEEIESDEDAIKRFNNLKKRLKEL